MSYILLSIYLMAVLHSVTSPVPPDALHHQHEDFERVHHEHAFHIGIFHFLGHLMEKIGQQKDLADDYLQPALVLPSKNADDENSPADLWRVAVLSSSANVEVNINDPPENHLPLLFSQLSILSSRPLRAPPVC